MLQRILEPEVMDTTQEAFDYDSMDHSGVNRVFVDDFLKLIEKSQCQLSFDDASNPFQILDVGTGTAQIPIELCNRTKHCQVTAIDLAQGMLNLAQQNVDAAGFENRVQLELIDAKQLRFESDSFDAVISNSIVHHIPKPISVFSEMNRVLKPGGFLLIRDLLRPNEKDELQHLVETYAKDENTHQRQMFADSLHAALTVQEVRNLLISVDLPPDWVQQTTDRHWTSASRG